MKYHYGQNKSSLGCSSETCRLKEIDTCRVAIMYSLGMMQILLEQNQTQVDFVSFSKEISCDACPFILEYLLSENRDVKFSYSDDKETDRIVHSITFEVFCCVEEISNGKCIKPVILLNTCAHFKC